MKEIIDNSNNKICEDWGLYVDIEHNYDIEKSIKKNLFQENPHSCIVFINKYNNINYRDVNYRDVNYKDVNYKDVNYKDVNYKDVNYKEDAITKNITKINCILNFLCLSIVTYLLILFCI
jgi:hypothetical protein